MKRITTILSFLMLLCMGAGADVVVTINDQTELSDITNNVQSEATAVHKYGTYSGSTTANTPPYTTFTTNTTSGVPGLEIYSEDKVLRPHYEPGAYLSHYGHVMAIYTSGTTSSTIKITAPSGYKIKSYAMTALSTSGTNYFNITPSGGSTKTAKGYSEKANLNIDVDATSTTFTVARATNKTSTLCISRFTVTLVPTGSEISVKYVVLDASGAEAASTTVSTYTETKPFVPSSISHTYCTYGNFYNNNTLTGDAVTTLSAATTLYTRLSVSPSCPITFSTEDSPVYYYLKLRDSYIYSENSEATYPSLSTNTIVSTKEGAWAFIGNPYSFKIINKIVGKGKYLARNTSVSSGGENGTTFNTTGTEWRMDSHYLGGGFRIYDPTPATAAHIYTDNTSLMWLTWNGLSSDPNGGGRFVATLYNDDFTPQVSANIKPYFDKYDSDGEVYFGITTATYNDYNRDYTAALDECTEDNYAVLYSNIMSGIKYPETGYYRLKNNSTGNYLGYDGSLVGTMSSSAVASVVKMTKNASGYYSLKVQDKYVQYPTKSAVAVTTGTTEKYLVPELGAPGLVLLKSQESPSAFIYLGLSGGNAMSCQSSDATAKWSVEPATDATVSLTAIGGNTYATTCLPFDVKVKENTITANAVLESDVHVGYVVPTALEDKEIPAGTPVILKGSSTSATSATLTINTGDAFSAISGTSALEGVYVNTAFALTEGSTTDYFLGMLDGVLGFYHSGIETPASSGNYTLSANRAYLPASVVAAAGSRGFSIKWDDDEITGISGAKHLNDQSEMINDKQMFDLQGRRVENPQRGLYIVGGRKIVIK